MSTKSLVAGALLSVLLSACGVDNDMIQAEVVGSWILKQQDKSECNVPEDEGSEGFVCSSFACSRIIFSDSSTYFVETTIDGITTSENGSYSVDGAQLLLCTEADEEQPSVCAEWSMILQSTTLIVSASEKIDGCQVRWSYVRS